jgi:hypothetical protein
MYEAGFGAILSLFGGIAQHPSEGTLPNHAKGSDIILADSDVHIIPYIYLAGTILLVIISLIVIFKK